MTRSITLKQLKHANACSDFVATFGALFPSGTVKVTERTALALAQWANFYFLAHHLLRPKQKKVYNKALDGPTYGERINAIRSHVPNFDALSYLAKNSLLTAFQEAATAHFQVEMAKAFVLAYNSPRT